MNSGKSSCLVFDPELSSLEEGQGKSRTHLHYRNIMVDDKALLSFCNVPGSAIRTVNYSAGIQKNRFHINKLRWLRLKKESTHFSSLQDSMKGILIWID